MANSMGTSAFLVRRCRKMLGIRAMTGSARAKGKGCGRSSLVAATAYRGICRGRDKRGLPCVEKGRSRTMMDDGYFHKYYGISRKAPIGCLLFIVFVSVMVLLVGGLTLMYRRG